jgi:hypothetical protein
MKKIFTYLIAAAALMIISAAAMAQGGETPFLNSTHTYTVTMDDGTSNTALWVIADATGTPLATQPAFTTDVTGNTATMEITWATVGSFKVQFSETAQTTACVAAKELDVTVSANTFDVFTSNPGETCNAADGQINYSGTTATTTVVFKVDMATGNTAFSPDWAILFSLTPPSGATIAGVSASSGDLAAGSVSGSYSLINLTSSTGTGTVDITIDVTGDIHTLLDVDFEITSATELEYNTPDVDTDDWMATQTINAIPNTTDITTD